MHQLDADAMQSFTFRVEARDHQILKEYALIRQCPASPPQIFTQDSRLRADEWKVRFCLRFTSQLCCMAVCPFLCLCLPCTIASDCTDVGRRPELSREGASSRAPPYEYFHFVKGRSKGQCKYCLKDNAVGFYVNASFGFACFYCLYILDDYNNLRFPKSGGLADFARFIKNVKNARAGVLASALANCKSFDVQSARFFFSRALALAHCGAAKEFLLLGPSVLKLPSHLGHWSFGEGLNGICMANGYSVDPVVRGGFKFLPKLPVVEHGVNGFNQLRMLVQQLIPLSYPRHFGEFDWSGAAGCWAGIAALHTKTSESRFGNPNLLCLGRGKVHECVQDIKAFLRGAQCVISLSAVVGRVAIWHIGLQASPVKQSFHADSVYDHYLGAPVLQYVNTAGQKPTLSWRPRARASNEVFDPVPRDVSWWPFRPETDLPPFSLVDTICMEASGGPEAQHVPLRIFPGGLSAEELGGSPWVKSIDWHSAVCRLHESGTQSKPYGVWEEGNVQAFYGKVPKDVLPRNVSFAGESLQPEVYDVCFGIQRLSDGRIGLIDCAGYLFFTCEALKIGYIGWSGVSSYWAHNGCLTSAGDFWSGEWFAGNGQLLVAFSDFRPKIPEHELLTQYKARLFIRLSGVLGTDEAHFGDAQLGHDLAVWEYRGNELENGQKMHYTDEELKAISRAKTIPRKFEEYNALEALGVALFAVAGIAFAHYDIAGIFTLASIVLGISIDHEITTIGHFVRMPQNSSFKYNPQIAAGVLASCDLAQELPKSAALPVIYVLAGALLLDLLITRAQLKPERNFFLRGCVVPADRSCNVHDPSRMYGKYGIGNKVQAGFPESYNLSDGEVGHYVRPAPANRREALVLVGAKATAEDVIIESDSGHDSGRTGRRVA